MKTEIVKIKGDWQDVVDGCRATVSKPPLGHEPSTDFKRRILIAEHEPIREIWIKWRWASIKYWIAMHWKTHIWPSRVNTQRSDRTGVPRDELPQGKPVDFTGIANLQHLIDTMRKRLCHQADPETRAYAEDLKEALDLEQTEISDALVPNCVYRGGCPEIRNCGLWERFTNWVDKQDCAANLSNIRERYALYNTWFYEAYKKESEIRGKNTGEG